LSITIDTMVKLKSTADLAMANRLHLVLALYLQGGPKVLSQEFCPPAILNSRGKGMVLQCKV